MNRLRALAPATLLGILVVALYRKVLRLWWTYDDANMLRMIVEHSVPEWFWNGAVWPQKLFTPLVMVAFEADLAAFGLAPKEWFVVHVVFCILSALAFYFALREWFAPWVAAAGASIYVASVPLVSLITELSGIHYLMTIAFGSLATIAYVRALRRDRMPPAIVSAVIYLIAMLAKETAAPLAILIVFLPERDARARLRFAIPHFIALAVYMIWRRVVIGTFLGGYGWATELRDWPALLASLPKKIVLASTGVGVALGAVLIVVMLIGVEKAVARRRGWLLFLVALALATGPILPVSKEMQRRYALMPWLVWSVAFIAGADVIRRKHPRFGTALLVTVPLLAVVVNRQEWGYEYGRTLRMSDEARFFFDMPPDTLLREPIVPPAAMGELNWLKSVHLGRPSGAIWFYDDYFVCANEVASKRAWQYEPAKRAIVDVSLADVKSRHCPAIRNAPLRTEFAYRNSTLYWRFGPYAKGKYRVLIANGVQAFDVPREDGFRLPPEVPGIALRVRYDSPEGWTAYSDELALEFAKLPARF